MKASTPRRLLVIGIITALLTFAAFRGLLYWRVQRELNEPTREVTMPETVRVLPGFKLRLLHISTKEEGSWVAMIRDPQGRLVISSEDAGLWRATLKEGQVAKIERLEQAVKCSMGLLYASDSLYLAGQGPQGWGLYREKMDGERLGAPELFCLLPHTTIEHGPHSVVLGPDQKIYVVCGDFTLPPANVAKDSPLAHYADDQLLPRALEPHGIYNHLPPPAGFVLRVDLDGKHIQLFAGGTRNIYRLAFNADGEMFGVDNDAEMDIGSAWYRPVRLTHIVSGGNYGYRQSTGKLPEYDEDTLPATFNIGLGGPSGLAFVPANGHFPDSYKDACLAADWAFGRLMAIHLRPRGASYQATMETVLRGSPFNMADLVFGADGDLYILTGGRQTVSGLYRLSYEGPPEGKRPATTARQETDEVAGVVRNLRRPLELLQGRRDPQAAEDVWPLLNSPDRWIRYAARTALEFQDVDLWQERALSETNAESGLTSLLALARCGRGERQAALLRALDKFPFSRLTTEQALLKLRVMELSFIRQGRPSEDLAQNAIAMLDPLYPSTNDNINHELCQLLLYLQAPDAVAKSVDLLNQSPTQEEQTYYAMRLRTITNGWTMDLRKSYLTWFHKKRGQLRHRPDIVNYFRDVDVTYSDGASLEPFLAGFLEEAVATLNGGERQALAGYLPKPPVAPPPPPSRKFVKQWRMKDLEPDLGMLQWRRSRARGRILFSQAGCIVCHGFANRGGSVGPDLTAVGRRMTGRDILESILEPSKVVPEQYQNMVLTMKDGDVLTGRVMEENPQRLIFMTDPVQRTKVEIRQSEVESRKPSRISPMPEGLVNSFNEDEIWDLMSTTCNPAAGRTVMP